MIADNFNAVLHKAKWYGIHRRLHSQALLGKASPESGIHRVNAFYPQGGKRFATLNLHYSDCGIEGFDKRLFQDEFLGAEALRVFNNAMLSVEIGEVASP